MRAQARPLRVLLAGINLGQKKPGVALGPQVLRAAGAFGDTEVVDLAPHFSGNALSVVSGNSLEDHLGALTRERLAGDTAGTDVVVGGDHSLAVGSATGTLKRHPGAKLLWIDAHADINTPDTSPSGNKHGMPVATLLGWCGDRPPLIAPENIMYVGIRDLDPKEIDFIKDFKIAALSSQDVHDDTAGCIAKISNFLGNDPNQPVHISLDIDVLSDEYVPGTGTPVPGGLHPDQLSSILDEALSRWTPCIDVVEFNPELDIDGRAQARTIEMLNQILPRAATQS